MRAKTIALNIVLLCVLGVCQAVAQTFTLHGKVTDDANNPLELATISVVSQGKVAFSNLRGD